MSFKKIKADVIDLGHIEEQKNFPILGLIGYEVLKDCELLIDFQQRQVVLTRTNEAANHHQLQEKETVLPGMGVISNYFADKFIN